MIALRTIIAASSPKLHHFGTNRCCDSQFGTGARANLLALSALLPPVSAYSAHFPRSPFAPPRTERI
jgi:hypothetical protein